MISRGPVPPQALCDSVALSGTAQGEPRRKGLTEAGATLGHIQAGLRSPQGTALGPKPVTETEPTAKPC